jgi:prevent-host-death family protein
MRIGSFIFIVVGLLGVCGDHAAKTSQFVGSGFELKLNKAHQCAVAGRPFHCAFGSISRARMLLALCNAFVLTYVRNKVHLVKYSTYQRWVMTGITATEARSNLYRLIDETAESHRPIVIMGKRNRAVLISEEDWSAIQETLYLLSVPGMRESIREGMDTPVDQCDEELNW